MGAIPAQQVPSPRCARWHSNEHTQAVPRTDPAGERTDLDGVFLTLRTAARHIAEHNGGSLVAVSSTSAIHGAPNSAADAAGKTALLRLVRAMAVGLARHRIRVMRSCLAGP